MKKDVRRNICQSFHGCMARSRSEKQAGHIDPMNTSIRRISSWSLAAPLQTVHNVYLAQENLVQATQNENKIFSIPLSLPVQNIPCKEPYFLFFFIPFRNKQTFQAQDIYCHTPMER